MKNLITRTGPYWRSVLPVLLLYMTMHLSVLTNAQQRQPDILDKKVTFSLKEVSMEEALRTITDLTGIRFAFSEDHLKDAGTVTLEAQEETLREVLNKLLGPRSLVYRVYENERIAVTRKPPDNAASIPTATRLAGRVTGPQNEPMAGVSVVIAGRQEGMMTDSDGAYNLEVSLGDKVTFSFIGYVPQTMIVDDRTSGDIVLEAELTSLNELVVNAGYWQISKAEQTGNIARVTAKDIERQPVSNVLMALQARMPGVVITQGSGVPGSAMQIQIRGQNSLRNSVTDNGNLPLYVIDGVPVDASPVLSTGGLLSISGIDPLSTINPANIASIEVLKDADATAVYGSRGANGVVLITTKKGSPGNLRLDVIGYTGVGEISNRLDLMKTPEYLAMRREAFENDGVAPGIGDVDVNGTWSESQTTDWQEELLGGTANTNDVQASLSGGNGTTTFRIGGGYHNETMVFPGDFRYRKMMGNGSISHTTLDNKINIGLTVNYGADDNKLFGRNIIQDAIWLSPNAPGHNTDGTLDWTGYTLTQLNPYSYFETSHTSKSSSLITNTIVRYEIVKGLRLSANFGYSDNNVKQLIKSPTSSMHPDDTGEARAQALNNDGNTWITEPQISYTNPDIFGGKIDLLLGATWQGSNTQTFDILGIGFVSDNLLGNIRAARSVSIAQDEKVQYRYNAMFARIGYAWKEKYIINLTARRDGSSRFGADNQFGNFGAAGAAWVFSNEEFLSAWAPLSFGKLRISYGTTGSDYVGNYGYYSTYSPLAGSYSGTTILASTGLANPDYGWEVNKKLEAGLELGLFRDRIQFMVSGYRNRSSNQLVGYPLPVITGFNSVQYNLEATVQNTGVEFDISSVNIDTDAWRWRTGLTLTIPRNKLVSYPGIEVSSYSNTYVIGEPLTITKRYSFDGVDPATGLYRVKDPNEDGIINAKDRTEIVNFGRKMYAGITSTLTYKSFTLDVLMEWVRQTSSDYMSIFPGPPGTKFNQPAEIMDRQRWLQLGDEVSFQRFSQNANTPYAQMQDSDVNISDASYFRVKNISLTWKLSPAMLKATGLRDAGLFLQAQNILTITGYKGLNPELPALQLPPLRIVSLGIQLSL